ncbi:MAG: CPBP family glutamic-type intramembrane protease [Actinomycetota bacterium]
MSEQPPPPPPGGPLPPNQPPPPADSAPIANQPPPPVDSEPVANQPPPPVDSEPVANQPPAPLPGAAARASQPPPPPPGSEPVRHPSPWVANTYDHQVSRWGLGDFFITEAIFFGLNIAFIAAVLVWTDTDFGDTNTISGSALLLAAVGPPLLQLLYIVQVSRRRGAGLAKDFQLRFQASDIGLGLGLAVGGLILAGIIVAVMVATGSEQPSAAAIDAALDANDDGGITLTIILFALAGAIVIPFIEELVFRGLFWSALEKRGVSNNVSLVITTVVFAAIHLEPMRFFILLGLGFALGFARLRTGRIGAAIVAHMAINSLGMIGLLTQLA